MSLLNILLYTYIVCYKPINIMARATVNTRSHSHVIKKTTLVLLLTAYFALLRDRVLYFSH